jgi:hypothetical protein
MLEVNVTVVPGQTGNPGLALMLIVGVTKGFTVMLMELLIAVPGDGQLAVLVM